MLHNGDSYITLFQYLNQYVVYVICPYFVKKRIFLNNILFFLFELDDFMFLLEGLVDFWEVIRGC